MSRVGREAAGIDGWAETQVLFALLHPGVTPKGLVVAERLKGTLKEEGYVAAMRDNVVSDRSGSRPAVGLTHATQRLNG